MASLGNRVRKRLESIIDSPTVTNAAASLIASRVDRLHDATRWEYHGRDDVIDVVRSGQPVIFAQWHGRLAMSPKGWDTSWAPFCVVTSRARPGRMVGRVMLRYDFDTLPMRDKKANTATSLQVARMVRAGTTIGFAADGPEGPARKAKAVPIDWARLTGAPIWLFTNSFERYRNLKTWDRMAIPRPGGRGVMMYRRFGAEVPKRMDAQTREDLRRKLEAELDALTLEADRLMGHDGFIA